MDRLTFPLALLLAATLATPVAAQEAPPPNPNVAVPPPVATPPNADTAPPAPEPPPGTMVIQPTSPLPGEGTHVVVMVDGQPVPQAWYGRPIPVTRGDREVSAHVYDDDGVSLLAPRSARYFVESGAVSEVRLPAVDRSIDGAMLGGGIAVTTVATAATVWAGISFVASTFTTVCALEEFSMNSGCNNDASTPWLISGVASGLVGAGGTGLGIWMMVKGATPGVEWADPDVAIGPDGVKATFPF